MFVEGSLNQHWKRILKNYW